MIFGQFVRQNRKKLGMTVKQLAEKSGVSDHAIIGYERGSEPTIKTARLLCAALEADYVVKGSEAS